MTFNIGHVQGGTNGGRRRVIDKKYVPWQCDCDTAGFSHRYGVSAGRKLNPGYLVRCIDCKTERWQ